MKVFIQQHAIHFLTVKKEEHTCLVTYDRTVIINIQHFIRKAFDNYTFSNITFDRKFLNKLNFQCEYIRNTFCKLDRNLTYNMSCVRACVCVILFALLLFFFVLFCFLLFFALAGDNSYLLFFLIIIVNIYIQCKLQ